MKRDEYAKWYTGVGAAQDGGRRSVSGTGGDQADSVQTCGTGWGETTGREGV